MSLVRLSRFFMCDSCIVFRSLAMNAFSGIEKIMIATPTKAGHSKMS